MNRKIRRKSSIDKYIYRKEKNENIHTHCGSGSTLENTLIARSFISYILEKYKIKSVADIPCGNFSWMSKVDLTDIDYTGYDNNDLMIEEISIKYPKINFKVLDMVEDIISTVDLILCRDCLFHLPLEEIKIVLNNFKKSNSKYLLATTNEIEINKELKEHELKNKFGWRPINLEITPFNLFNSLEKTYESNFNRFLNLLGLN